MKPEFTPEFFQQNRERLRTLFSGTAPIILTANGQMQRNGDQAFPFRQDSSFWYLTGIDEPDVILVMDKVKEYLITPSREDWRDTFEGAVIDEKLSKISGISDILDEKRGWKRLSSRLKKARTAATLSASPPLVDHYGFYSNPARAHLLVRIKDAANQELELLDLRPHLARMRAIKQPIEIETMQYAIDVTCEVFAKIYNKRAKYEFENQVEADVAAHFFKAGLIQAYPPIIASGKNACTIHHFKNDSPIDKSGLLLMDIGGELHNYAADISRTYAVSEPTKRQQTVFDVVKEVHSFAFGLLGPGTVYKTYEEQVQQFMGEKLRELGLIKIIDKESVRKYFPHLTSHFLGLDTHDVYDVERPFEPGMVLTIEPGIYIPEEGIGVRIEDDVLITENGIKNLSEKLPVSLG